MSETLSLTESMNKILEKLDEHVKEDKAKNASFFSKWMFWKSPTRFQLKKNWVFVIYLQNNKNIKTLKLPIDENVIIIDGKPHVIDAGNIFLYKRKPAIIIPEWSIKPFSAEESVSKTETEGNSTKGWEYIVNYMKKSMIKGKSGGGIIIYIILGLAVIGGLYYLLKGAF